MAAPAANDTIMSAACSLESLQNPSARICQDATFCNRQKVVTSLALNKLHFWGVARNFNVSDTSLTESIRESQQQIFAEDVVVLEAQQKNLLAYPERRLMTLNIDAGGVHSRRLLDRMIAAERNTIGESP